MPPGRSSARSYLPPVPGIANGYAPFALAEPEPPPYERQPRLLDQLREALRSRHYSRRTEQAYCHWVRRYIFLQGPPPVGDGGAGDQRLPYAPGRQGKGQRIHAEPGAFSALPFLYRHVIGREVGDLGQVIRARKPRRLPVVMTREEVKTVLANLSGDKWLMASLMYGAGLRLMECLRLRVQDLDFPRNEILVRDAKGAKDRVSMLPESLKKSLQEHLKKVKTIHEKDLADGWGRVLMPMRWTENTPMPRKSGAGNGFFPRNTDGETPGPAKRGGITSMSRLCRSRCERR